ncbi:hypothetical protein [Krasilnikovia sp. MM14-A1004]|uniref:hypothetical protein n=1 Tax=Krasilnikovia sp. MM14-A1004 TaxID=3373541 RepID=UPI00399CD79B
MAVQRPKNVQVRLDLKLISVTGTWEPNDAERSAAWELYVEIITRAAAVPLQNGLLREALTSLYSLFGCCREILRRYGPGIAEAKRDGAFSLGYLVVAMLNYTVRPVLSYWHPELQAWEHGRPVERSPLEHEREWIRYEELQRSLAECRDHLATYAQLLAAGCGVPDLRTAIPAPPTDY